ncbi:hypothetical protein KAFR_0K02480 [Kazachstania africana CBS 2517]|uniref:Uncharacterized protein n=1 Tax=Kazachstania africana (strain ATCC 22294 / BCRC 22015 / CBS 2517 / CECT 1963 / NBRC 1671 / NRRL Y-8276) TaxID=1071382 RepID=H2B1V4_KAZAF|nr:hypothetical protein KAFR_0K02480 [Kazachstania africana CBS 2517]CCF60604.1 hypothetical protein KAFR_0K02480 [Kazachstania africana CBS 2517]
MTNIDSKIPTNLSQQQHQRISKTKPRKQKSKVKIQTDPTHPRHVSTTNTLNSSMSPSQHSGSTGEIPIFDLNLAVSDAMANNSRQLLYSHIYHYLLENKHYKTAKKFLQEAQLPLSAVDGSSTVSNKNSGNNTLNSQSLKPDHLVKSKMIINSPDTFLVEWWQSFLLLNNFVESCSIDELKKYENPKLDNIYPILPNNIPMHPQMNPQFPYNPNSNLNPYANMPYNTNNMKPSSAPTTNTTNPSINNNNPMEKDTDSSRVSTPMVPVSSGIRMTPSTAPGSATTERKNTIGGGASVQPTPQQLQAMLQQQIMSAQMANMMSSQQSQVHPPNNNQMYPNMPQGVPNSSSVDHRNMAMPGNDSLNRSSVVNTANVNNGQFANINQAQFNGQQMANVMKNNYPNFSNNMGNMGTQSQQQYMTMLKNMMNKNSNSMHNIPADVKNIKRRSTSNKPNSSWANNSNNTKSAIGGDRDKATSVAHFNENMLRANNGEHKIINNNTSVNNNNENNRNDDENGIVNVNNDDNIHMMNNDLDFQLLNLQMLNQSRPGSEMQFGNLAAEKGSTDIGTGTNNVFDGI